MWKGLDGMADGEKGKGEERPWGTPTPRAGISQEKGKGSFCGQGSGLLGHRREGIRTPWKVLRKK